MKLKQTQIDRVMKKRIFVLGHWMRIDGVATSLLGLLTELDYSEVQVDLMLMSAEGELLNEIPKEVKLLSTPPAVEHYWRGRGIISLLVSKVAIYLAGCWYRLIKRQKIDPYGLFLIKGFLFNFILPRKIVDTSYDLALFFSCQPFLTSRVNARKKLVWVHSDWGRFCPIKCLMNIGFGKSDYIVNVSSDAKYSFDRYLSNENKLKSIVIENCMSQRRIIQQEKEFIVESNSGWKILSVGRISTPKNYFRALEAAKILIERGVAFMWIIVGDGELFTTLKRAVEDANLTNCFQLVGQKVNPYPYYRWCDCLVCTSDWEGKSVAVREAQMLAKPVVVTKFPTAASQVEDGVDGLLVDLTPEAVANGIMKLREDCVLRDYLSNNCQHRDYTKRSEITKILALC